MGAVSRTEIRRETMGMCLSFYPNSWQQVTFWSGLSI
jgi:hypothetical protein